MSDLALDPQKWFKSLPEAIMTLYSGKFKLPATTMLDKTLGELLVANFKIWRYEDEARRTDLPDKDIANLKRNIDR